MKPPGMGAFNYRPTFSGAFAVRFQGVEIGDIEPFVDTSFELLAFHPIRCDQIHCSFFA